MATKTRSISQSFTPTESLSITISVWAYINSHSDTLSTTDSGLSKTVSTYRTDNTLSDSLSNSENLARSVATWYFPNTFSDTLSSSESLARSIDTWRHVLSYNMTLTNSESLSKSVSTYRFDNTFNQSLTIAENFSLSTDTWFHTFSPQDNVTPSESLNVATQLWFHTNSNSDTLNIVDGLEVQTPIDIDTYFLDTGDLRSKTALKGYITSGNFTSDASSVQNEDNLIDGNISSTTTFSSSNTKSCVVYDLGSAVQFNFVGIYGNGGSLKIYASNSQGSGYNFIHESSIGNKKWVLNVFENATYRYWAIQFENLSANAYLHEILIGKSFKPEVRYALGSSEHSMPQLISSESYTGTEYVNKKGEDEVIFNRNYENISAGLKSEFESIQEKHIDRKFLYYANGIKYVQMDPLVFTEVAHNRYNTQIILNG